MKMESYKSYHDLSHPAGRETFGILAEAEAGFVVPQSYFDDERSEKRRRFAVAFIEIQYSRSCDVDAIIPYTAMDIFDRFFARDEILPTATLQTTLFLTACLAIAWKLQSNTFMLSRFLIESSLRFTVQQVIKMELLIMKGLKWKMRIPAPFCFVEYFIPVLDDLPPNSPSARRLVYQLIVRSQFDIAFTKYKPSVLAASAMLIVSSKMSPNMLEHRIFNYEYFIPQQDMLLKCIKELTPLYPYPSTPAVPHISIPINEPASGTGHIGSSAAQMKPTDPTVEQKEASGSVPTDPTVEQRETSGSVPKDPTVEQGEASVSAIKEPTVEQGEASESVPTDPMVEQGEASGSASKDRMVEQGEDPGSVPTDPTVEIRSCEEDEPEGEIFHHRPGKELASSSKWEGSDPTPVPALQNPTSPKTPTKPHPVPEGLLCLAALTPYARETEISPSEEDKEIFDWRSGKEPATSAAEVIQRRVRSEDEVHVVQVDYVMDFELGWIELQAQADEQRRDANVIPADVQGCWNTFGQRCSTQ